MVLSVCVKSTGENKFGDSAGTRSFDEPVDEGQPQTKDSGRAGRTRGDHRSQPGDPSVSTDMEVQLFLNAHTWCHC